MSDYHILIIDDSSTMRKLLSVTLNSLPNVKLFEAENGAEAFKILNQDDHQIDIILLDILMPVMDGFTFLEEMKAFTKKPKPLIVMITREGEESDHQKAIALGADAFITKPIKTGKLDATIKEMLKRRSQQLNPQEENC